MHEAQVSSEGGQLCDLNNNPSPHVVGAINLASRALPCLPSALFDIHLGITPEPLKLVPVEPPITTATSDDFSAASRKKEASSGPSWYEAQDLAVLKAWNNEIVEIQSEISMFGSLNTIDVRPTISHHKSATD